MRSQTTRWYTARTRPWPDAIPTVQVADDYEKFDPGLLADGWGDDRSEYARLTDEYDDPRDAVAAAVQMRDLWQTELGASEVVVLSIAPGPEWVPSESSEEDLAAWSERIWDSLPVCEHCGHKGSMSKYEYDGLDLYACDEHHATLAAWRMEEDAETLA